MNRNLEFLKSLSDLMQDDFNIDGYYNACILIDEIIKKIEMFDLYSETDLRLDVSRFEWFTELLTYTVDTYTESKSNYSEMFNNSVDADLKRLEYDSRIGESEMTKLRNKLSQMNKNRRIKKESQSQNKKVPILQNESGEPPSVSGSKGQIIAAEETKVQLSKIANCIKTEAIRSQYGAIFQNLKEIAEDPDNIDIKETFGETDLEKYDMTIHELVNEKYKENTGNIIAEIGTVIAVGTAGLKVISKIINKSKEKRIQDIKDDIDLLNKQKSTMVTLMMEIKRIFENMIINMVNKNVSEREDNSWWDTISQRMGDIKSYKTIYGLYKLRYNEKYKPILSCQLLNVTREKYDKNDSCSVLLTPDKDMVAINIIHSKMNYYISSRKQIYDMNDIYSYFEYYNILSCSSILYQILFKENFICDNNYSLTLTAGTKNDTFIFSVSSFMIDTSNEMEYTGYIEPNGNIVKFNFRNFKELLERAKFKEGQNRYVYIIDYIYEILGKRI